MTRTLSLVLLGLGAAALAHAANPADTCPSQSTYNAAYKIETASNGPQMGIWYPTTDAESPYQYLSGTNGSVALNGSPACGQFPLVVFSHGYGGCGVQSVFFTEQLSRQGYIVAAPDHMDASCSVTGTGHLSIPSPQQSFSQPQTWTDNTYIDRKNDVESVINWMTGGGSSLSGSVDSSRIALSGHSLGGYTVLGVGGAWATWLDPRIKAVLAFAPYAYPFLYDNRLRGVNIPVMYQDAQGDVFILPSVQGVGGSFEFSNSPKYFMELPGGTHFSWTNFACGSLTVSQCLQTNQLPQLINAYAFAFLDVSMKGSSAPLASLNGANLLEWDHALPLASLPAGYAPANTPVAPNSIVSSYGTGLAPSTSSTPSPQLPTSLANTSVAVLDSSAHNLSAPLYFVSSGQINFVVPESAADGQAQVTVTSQGSVVASGLVQIQSVSPSVLVTGPGAVPAAQVLQFLPNGQQNTSITFDPQTGAAVPINLGQPGDQTYLILYGTGMRGASSATAVIGSTSVPAVGPFAQSQYAGLDQINVGPIPLSLAGSGKVNVVVTMGGKTASAVTIDIQ